MSDGHRELDGKVAIVTGSARNIGRAIAEELARAGAAVVVNAVTAEALAREVADGIVADGGRAIAVRADVRKPEDCAVLARKAVEAFGGIDILVHNAASRSNVPFDEMTYEQFYDVIDVSLIGMFHLAKAAVPEIRKRGSGAIVAIGGMTSTMGAPGRAHVMASKMGQAAFVRGLALDLAKDGIRANNVVVGAFETERTGSTASPTSPRQVAIPLGRKGVPDDIARLVRFIAGPNASYITGESIHCNGGAYLNL